MVRGGPPRVARSFPSLQPALPCEAGAGLRPRPREAGSGVTTTRGEALPREAPRRAAAAAHSASIAEASVAIVGAGIVGICTAWELARDGVDVILVERDQPNAHASGNNAGSLHVQLLAYDFGDLASAAGLPAAQTLPLQRESARLWPVVAETLGADLEISRTGGLMVAETEEQMVKLRPQGGARGALRHAGRGDRPHRPPRARTPIFRSGSPGPRTAPRKAR